jgi:WD40 repeat protein
MIGVLSLHAHALCIDTIGPQLSCGANGTVSYFVTCDHYRYILSACDDASVRIWELDTGQYASVLAGHTGAVHLAVVAADHNLVVTASKDLTMRAWSVTAALQSTVLQPPHPEQNNKL